MKKRILSLLFIGSSFLFFAQQVVVTSGATAKGVGSVSYTVGQIFSNTNVGKNGSVSEGMHQAIELFVLSNPEFTAVTLKAKTYPNPTKDKIIVSLKDNELNNLLFTVFDIKGRLLKKGKLNNDNTSIAMKSFASGIYILKVHQNKKQLKSFKIIKN